MNKAMVVFPLTVLLATNVSFAGSTNIANPSAMPNPSALAYGCFVDPDGRFGGRRGCQGQVVDAPCGNPCFSPSDVTVDEPPESTCAPANPCAGKGKQTDKGNKP